MANRKRLMNLVATLVLYPQSYDQGMWAWIPVNLKVVKASQVAEAPVCGSKFCAAGHAAAQGAPRGSLFAIHADDFNPEAVAGNSARIFIPDAQGSHYLGKDSLMHWVGGDTPAKTRRYRRERIADFAARYLEITGRQANWLFDASRKEHEIFLGIRMILDDPAASWDDLNEVTFSQ